MDTFLRDVRYALRRLQQSPGFALVVVLTLALGIGANTAIFSVVDAVLLRPLPYREPGRLVTINHFYHSLNDLEASVSVPGFVDYRDKTRSFEGVAVETGWSANLTGTGEPERVPAEKVSGDWFRVLGIAPQLGRAIGRDDDAPGKNRVVVLSDGMWRRVFGADPRIVGREVQLNGENYQVIGVMPPGFRSFFTRDVDLWTPIAFTPDQLDPQRYTNEFLNLTARLKPGISIEQAKREMAAFADVLKQQNPDRFAKTWTLKVTSLDERATAKIRPTLYVLLGAVGFVLLIACANVANLLLARGAVRMKEIAIRSALGAERSALVRQLLTESVILAVVGGVLGLAIAYASVRAVVAAYPTLPRASDIGIDGRVMLFTLGVAVVTGVVFGLVPAMHTSRTDLQTTLREGGRTGSSDASGRARRALVVAEMALALTLLVGAGLLIRSVARLQRVDPGFRPERLLTFNIALPAIKYPSDTSRRLFARAAVRQIESVPGVTAAGWTTTMPFTGDWSTASFDIDGYQPGRDQPGPWGDIRAVTPDFFRTMGMPVKSGRGFTDQDDAGSQLVAVVDDEMAKKFFRGESPIGHRVSFGGPPGQEQKWITIVGVVPHSMQEALDAEPRVQLYLPYAQNPYPRMSVAVRTTGEPLAMTRLVRAAVRAVDPDMPISDVRTMDDLMESSLGQRRLTMTLLGAFAGIALMLAAIGIYGVMSYAVTQRSRELGIRMALGAARGGVLTLVLRQGLGLATLGIGIGVAGALALTRLLATQLYAVKATDPSTFVVVALGLAVVAAGAVLVPALRATRVDPLVALREE